jgi:hypothetical protein
MDVSPRELLFPTESAAAGDAEPSSSLPPDLRDTGLQLYRQAWDAYREAGCPYGESDEAMLVWYSFQEENTGGANRVGRN